MRNEFQRLLGMDIVQASTTDLLIPLMLGAESELIDEKHYLQIQRHGIGFIADFDGRVSTIFLYSEGKRGYSQFTGVLPEGVSFEDSQRSIHERLGQPTANGGGEVIPLYGKASKWDRYALDGYSLHIQYAEGEGSIELVTIMRPDSVPR
jgi:hypothetical protein